MTRESSLCCLETGSIWDLSLSSLGGALSTGQFVRYWFSSRVGKFCVFVFLFKARQWTFSAFVGRVVHFHCLALPLGTDAAIGSMWAAWLACGLQFADSWLDVKDRICFCHFVLLHCPIILHCFPCCGFICLHTRIFLFPFQVTEIRLKYFDTVPVAAAMCVLKTGFLFVASEFGNQWVVLLLSRFTLVTIKVGERGSFKAL